MLAKKKVRFTADTAAKTLVKTKGISTEFGAREIDRVISGNIKPLLVDEILFGRLNRGGTCKLTALADDFQVLFEKEQE